MTTKSEIVRDDVIAHLVGLFLPLNLFEQRLSLALYRSLAEGQPVRRERLAQRLEWPTETINKTLDAWSGVFSDAQQRIVGYWGLALSEAYKGPHRMTLGDQILSAWCAWDTLFLPQLLGQTAEIESSTPAGFKVHLRVTPKRIEHRYPKNIRVSFLLADAAAVQKDVLSALCHFIHFFPSQEAGEEWIAQHHETFLLSLDDAYEVARRTGSHISGCSAVTAIVADDARSFDGN